QRAAAGGGHRGGAPADPVRRPLEGAGGGAAGGGQAGLRRGGGGGQPLGPLAVPPGRGGIDSTQGGGLTPAARGDQDRLEGEEPPPRPGRRGTARPTLGLDARL